MRITPIAVLTVAAMLSLGTIAQAQGGKPNKAEPGARGQLRARAVQLATVPVKTLDAVVKLTPEQKTKIEAIQTQFASDAKALRPAKGQPRDPEARQKLADLTKKATEDITAVLTQEQKDKLKAALKEMAPLMAAGIPPALVVELKLTPEQRTRIEGIVKDARAGMKGLSADAKRAKMAEVKEAVLKVLTDEQKKKVEEFQAARQRKAGARAKAPKK